MNDTLCASPTTCQHTAVMNDDGVQVACGPVYAPRASRCDHVDHPKGTVAPQASTEALITWTDGTQTLRHLCPGHASEFRHLLAMGASAFGRIESVDFTHGQV